MLIHQIDERLVHNSLQHVSAPMYDISKQEDIHIIMTKITVVMMEMSS